MLLPPTYISQKTTNISVLFYDFLNFSGLHSWWGGGLVDLMVEWIVIDIVL